MSRSIISLFFLMLCMSGAAQRLGKEKDTTEYKDRYGIRVGLDIVRPIYSFFDENDKGFELVGDYRLTKRFYLAAELGYRVAGGGTQVVVEMDVNGDGLIDSEIRVRGVGELAADDFVL